MAELNVATSLKRLRRAVQKLVRRTLLHDIVNRNSGCHCEVEWCMYVRSYAKSLLNAE